MGSSKGPHPVRGILAGIAGGLVASWVMNEFISGAGPKLQHALQTDQQNAEQEKQAEQTKDQPQEDATMKTADAIVNTVTGGEHLSWEAREKGGPIVHYTFGALMGALYGGLAEYSPAVRSAFGTTFGSVLFTGADLFAVPALHLSGSPADQPKSALATPFAAHLVYGATTELVRRIVRQII